MRGFLLLTAMALLCCVANPSFANDFSSFYVASAEPVVIPTLEAALPQPTLAHAARDVRDECDCPFTKCTCGASCKCPHFGNGAAVTGQSIPTPASYVMAPVCNNGVCNLSDGSCQVQRPTRSVIAKANHGPVRQATGNAVRETVQWRPFQRLRERRSGGGGNRIFGGLLRRGCGAGGCGG